MANEEKLRTFGKPHALGPLPGSATVAGIRNNGSIGFDGETFVIVGHPGQNNPTALAAHTESLERMGTDWFMTLSVRMERNPRRAAIGWMRAAYLTAFAVHGYRYVLQPAFGALRAAIADPDSSGFEPVILQGPDDGALDPLIAEVTEPAWLTGCRVVIFGPRVIVLPPWAAPEDWFATLQGHLTSAFPVNLTFVSVIGGRFPDRPMHLTDG
jgi:hypothetical protein